MHNFKYHSLEELEDLIENLKKEIAFNGGEAVDLGELFPDVSSLPTIQERNMKDSEDMLRAAEFEVMERTLLK
jgi:hypothetical protein